MRVYIFEKSDGYTWTHMTIHNGCQILCGVMRCISWFACERVRLFQAMVTFVLLSLRVDGWCVTWAGEVTEKQLPFTPWGQTDVNTNKPGTGTHSFFSKIQTCTHTNQNLEKSMWTTNFSRKSNCNKDIQNYLWFDLRFGRGCDDALLKLGGRSLQNSQTALLGAAWFISPSHTYMHTSCTHTNTVHACSRWADGEKSGVYHEPPTLSTSALVAAQALKFPT